MGYFENNIYIQSPHSCVRNKAINNFNTSSDMCIFSSPTFTMEGAGKITSCLDGVDYSLIHIISTATTQDLTFEFTGNTSEFINSNAAFKYEIYKLDTNIGQFIEPPILRSQEIEWSSFSGTSAYTATLPLDELKIDGDYLIKGYFTHDVCTEFANKLGYRNDTSLFKVGGEFGLYQASSDYYMSIFREAETPRFDRTIQTSGILTLQQKVILPEDGQTTFILPDNVEADFIVSLNGLILAKGLDYTITNYSGGTQPIVITMVAPTQNTDIVTIIYGSNNTTGLKTDTYDITSITSGATNGEGNNHIYYNSDTNKYELFLTLTPSSGNDILVMINGVTLAYGVDYYQSISNPKRVIFEGDIKVGDIIVAAYNQASSFIEEIKTSTPTIGWSIENAPTLVNGEFILEFSSDDAMKTQVSSASTSYEIGVNSYELSTIIKGSVGTELYYRVKNIKNYVNICGDKIESIAYSEIIPITIATNSINSY